MHQHRFARRTFWAEPDEVHDLEDAERVDDEKRDKPPLLAAARGVPEREALQDDGPERHHKDDRDKNTHKLRGERRIKWREWLHMCGLYHTLYRMRYLGIDYGSKRVGLALSDEAGTMGFPHAVIRNSPRLIDELCARIAKENIGAVVIGESRDLAGDKNPIAKSTHALGDLLTLRAGVPVLYESEVFTSAEARRMPSKQEKTRTPKRHGEIDASAAALILTSYLTRQKGR